MSNADAANIIASLAPRFEAMPYTGHNASGEPTKRIRKVVDGMMFDVTQGAEAAYWVATALCGEAWAGRVAR